MIEMSIVEEEVTDKDIDEPDLKGLRIPNHCILLRPIRVDKKTKSGVLLPSDTHSDISYLTNICKVLKLGERAYKQEMFAESGPWCKEGDFVVIGKFEGQKIKFKGIPMTLVSCDRIIAILDNPEDIDPIYNIGTNLN